MSCRNAIIGLGILTVGLAIIAAWSTTTLALTQIRFAFAEDQTRTFELLRRQALESGTQGAQESLQGLIDYYPSGSKQAAGSQWDSIVERARASAIEDVKRYLELLADRGSK